MKRFFNTAIILLLCALLAVGILYLEEHAKPTDAGPLDDVKPVTDSFYRDFIVTRQGLILSEEFDGVVENIGEPSQSVIILKGQAGRFDEYLSLQGKTLEKDTLIYGNTRAPFLGRVDRVAVNSGAVEITLINYEDTAVVFQLPQNRADYLSLGSELIFRYNGREYKGKVTYLSQIIENSCITVEMEFSDPDLKILMNAQVQVIVVIEQKEDVIMIPSNALMQSASGQYFVYVKGEDGKKESREVVLGVEFKGETEIIGGLTAGDVVLIDMSSVDEEPAED